MLKKVISLVIMAAMLAMGLASPAVFALDPGATSGATKTTKKSVKIWFNFGQSERSSESTSVGDASSSTATTYGESGKLENLGSGSFTISVNADSSGNVSLNKVSRKGYNGNVADNIFFTGSYLLNGTDNPVSDGKHYREKESCPSNYPIRSAIQYDAGHVGDAGHAYYTCRSENSVERKFTDGYSQDDKLVYIWLNTDKIGGEVSGDEIAYSSESSSASCGIVINGTIDELNSSAQKCAETLDAWRGHKIDIQNPYYEFGTIKFTNTNGEVTVYNEENKSTDELIASGELNKDADAKNDDSGTDICYDNAGVIGWALCPVISATADFTKSFYNEWLKPQLEIDASALFNENKETQEAWAVFRDIANISFVILFLIVILSQLTGFGIDNYGIKRMLPRLIVAAILVNLSFFICQFVVDVANIAGVGISKIIPEISAQIDDVSNYPNAGQYTFTFLAGTIGVATLLAMGPGIVISVVLSAISILFSVVFLFAILVARQSAAVILIVISPLALVCYLLPNTESLSKKWGKVFRAALLLYPICSLVIAAGGLAGGILASAGQNNPGMRFAAMLVQVIPYIAIPALVKNSMSGLGNLGARISGLGKTFSKNTVGRLSNSAVIKNTRTAMDNFDPGGLRARVADKTGIGRRRRIQQITADNERRSEGLKLKTALATNANMRNSDYQKMQESALEQQRLEDDSKIWAAHYGEDSSNMQGDFVEAMRKNDGSSGQLEGIINTYMANRNYDGLYDALKSASAAGADSSAMKRAAKAMRDNRNFGELSKKRTSLGEWAKGDIDDAHDIADAVYDNVDSFKPKDWAAMNGNERKEAFEALDILKRVADSGDAQATARYRSATNNMRAAADNEQLKADMDDDVATEYRRYAGPAQTSTPIARQAPGTNTSGGTLEVRNGNQPAPARPVTPPSNRTAPPSWAERESRNAVQSGSGVLLTGEDPRAGLNLPGNNNQGNA